MTELMNITVDVLVDDVHELGEGARYDARTGELCWVDLLAGHLHIAGFDGSTLRPRRTISAGVTLGVAQPAAAGGWTVGAGDGLGHLDEHGVLHLVARPEQFQLGATRMNDGAVDPAGRFWVGSMAYDERRGAGSLYRLGLDGRCTAMVHGLTISNGLGWSPDAKTMYVTDTIPGHITAYDFDVDDGTLRLRDTLVRSDGREGAPDGLAIDDDGCIWTAMWGGGAVERYAPDGRLLGVLRVPARQPTSCAFVRGALVITSGWMAMAERGPDDGKVFVADVGIDGPPVTPAKVPPTIRPPRRGSGVES